MRSFLLQFSLCFICWWMCSIIKSLKKISWMCNVNLINGKNSMSKSQPRAQCMLHCMPVCSATRCYCLLISYMYCSSQILTDLIWWCREEHHAYIQCALKMYYHMRDYKKNRWVRQTRRNCAAGVRTQAITIHNTLYKYLLRMTLWTGSRQYLQIRQSLTKHTRCKLHNTFVIVAQVFFLNIHGNDGQIVVKLVFQITVF